MLFHRFKLEQPQRAYRVDFLPFHQQKTSTLRRFSLDSSRPTSQNASSSLKSSRKSVELTICLRPEVESSNVAKSKNAIRRKSVTAVVVENHVERFDYPVKMEEVVVKSVDVEPPVDRKPFMCLDQDFLRDRSTQAMETIRSVGKKKDGNAVPRACVPHGRGGSRRDINKRPSDADASTAAITRIEPFPQLDTPQTRELNRSNLESSQFSWSSNSLSPIQDDTFSALPQTIPYADSPQHPSQPSFRGKPSSSSSPGFVETFHVPPTLQPSAPAYHAAANEEDPRPSFPSISHSPSSVTPPPPFPSAPSNGTGIPSLSSNQSALMSVRATPSPGATACVTPQSLESSASTSSSSSASLSLSNDSPSPDAIRGSLFTIPPLAPYQVSDAAGNLVDNNNIGDLPVSPKRVSKSDVERSSCEGTPSKVSCSSPFLSEKDDSKTSFELFNVRLADDVIVLKCSVCDSYTVECRSLNDVSILTKVSNHIMEHVDLMS